MASLASGCAAALKWPQVRGDDDTTSRRRRAPKSCGRRQTSCPARYHARLLLLATGGDYGHLLRLRGRRLIVAGRRRISIAGRRFYCQLRRRLSSGGHSHFIYIALMLLARKPRVMIKARKVSSLRFPAAESSFRWLAKAVGRPASRLDKRHKRRASLFVCVCAASNIRCSQHTRP